MFWFVQQKYNYAEAWSLTSQEKDIKIANTVQWLANNMVVKQLVKIRNEEIMSISPYV